MITFGSGTSQYSNKTPADIGFSTTYRQAFLPTTNDGQFSLINSIHNDFGGAWHTGALDHTDDENGYMFLVNAEGTPGVFYDGSVDDLCVGERYEFSAFLTNICIRPCPVLPNVKFEIHSANGSEILASQSSGDIPIRSNLTWLQVGFSFTAITSSIKLLMISNARGNSGNDLAIDDIALRVCSLTSNGVCPSSP